MVNIKRVSHSIKNVSRKAAALAVVGIFLSNILCYGLVPVSTSKNPVIKREILADLKRNQITNTGLEESSPSYKTQAEIFEKFITTGRGFFNFERHLVAQHWQRLRYIIEEIIKGNMPEMVPYEVEIQPESSCNLNCKHCVGRDYRPAKRRFISKADMKRFVQSIIEYNKKYPNLKISRIRVSGIYGEPLINKKAILAGIKLAIAAGIEVGLFTNGLLLDKEAREVIVDGLYVHVSLDAASEQSHKAIKGKKGFERIIRNIEELVRLRKDRGSTLGITVGYILNKENHNGVYSIVRRIKKLGVDTIRFKKNINPAEGQVVTKEEFDEAFRQIAKAKDNFEDENFKIVAIHSQEEAESEFAIPDFRRCYFAYLVGVIGDRGAVFACDHSTGVPEDDKKWLRSLKKDDYINALKISSKKLANIEPRKDCELCPPSGYKINSFAEFLRQTEEINPGFLDYIEINYVVGLKRDLALSYIKSGNYDLAGNMYHEITTIFDRHGDASMAVKMEKSSKIWKDTASILTRIMNYSHTTQTAREDTILISGATGFIGSHLTEKLLGTPDAGEIVILVPHKNNRARALKEIDSRIKVEICDIRNADKINDVFKRIKPKIVYHLAGSLEGTYDTSVDEKENVYNINVGGTLNLAKAAQENGTKLFVYTSTTRVYGRQTGEMPDVIDEGTMPNPVYPYEISKFIGEEIIRNIAQSSNMHYLTARLTNVAGEFRIGTEQNEARDVTARFISDVFNNRSVATYSDSLRNSYNFIDIDTVTNILVRILNRTDMYNQCFNISPGVATSLEDLLKSVEEILGRKVLTKKIDKPGGLSNVSSGVVFSNAKIKQYLGNSVISIKEVVRKTVEKFVQSSSVKIRPYAINKTEGFFQGQISRKNECPPALDNAAKVFNKIQVAA